jgi:ATP phosphoribosyltransferase
MKRLSEDGRLSGESLSDEKNNIEATPSSLIPHPSSLLTIAVAKGRMQEQTLELLGRAGVSISDEALSSRRLAVRDVSGLYRFLFVKPADVPVYVEHGIADCGIVGRDVLLESGADLLQPLDLGIARCRISVAAPQGRSASLFSTSGALRVATKYPRIAAAHFGARGVPVEIIELSGSVELAPVLGLSDCIVDLVETGRTLRENGLCVVEDITESTGRLAVNRAGYQLKAVAVARLVGALKEATGQGLLDQ